jgi:hypothetical protein
MNVQELANIRLTVAAFLQHLADNGVHLMLVRTDSHLSEVHPVELHAIIQKFHDRVITSVIEQTKANNQEKKNGHN